MNCNVCKGPYHPATGHYISETVVWCGPCTRDFVKYIIAQHSRDFRIGQAKKEKGKKRRIKFYDHAYPPKKE